MSKNFDGSQLKKLREVQNMSLNDLSYILRDNGLNVVPSTIFHWERGDSEPKASQLFALSDILGVTFEYFFEEKHDLTTHININARSQNMGKVEKKQ